MVIKMRKIQLFTTLLLLTLYSSAFGLGGDGSTCDPSTVNWGSCTLQEVPFAADVIYTVNVDGGNYSTPYQANQANTRYILQGNITADSTAISVSANYVVIDLNGYSITYNNVNPGEGVTFGAWNKHHISIRNGSIIQGTAMSEGNEYGRGNNPIGTYSTDLAGTRSADNIHVANLYVKYGGRDVGGIICSGSYGLYEQNTIEDTYEFGTLKNRMQGSEALTGAKSASSATGSVYRNNTIVNTRHRGIVTGNNAEVYGNHITIRSIATNSSGVGQYEGSNISIHDNTIIGRGEHPIGVGTGGGTGNHDVVIYENIMDMQITALGVEYGSQYLNDPSATYPGNSATGIRQTWNAYDTVAYNNQITVVTDNRYTGTYSPTGATAYIDGGGKGLFIGAYVQGMVATFSNNTISVTGDGSDTIGITCSANSSDSLFVLNNTVTSSGYNLVLGDSYSRCNGYPLFSGNTFIKSGSDVDYRTYANTYNTTGNNSQARVVGSIYQGGAAADSYSFLPASSGITDVYFGAIVTEEYRYSYRLHDNNNTSQTLLTETFDPTITLAYANPGSTPDPVCDFGHPDLCLTQETCEAVSGLYWCDGACQVGECAVIGPQSRGTVPLGNMQ